MRRVLRRKSWSGGRRRRRSGHGIIHCLIFLAVHWLEKMDMYNKVFVGWMDLSLGAIFRSFSYRCLSFSLRMYFRRLVIMAVYENFTDFAVSDATIFQASS